MPYKLAIANTVTVPMNIKLADAGKIKSFSFTLEVERLDEDDFQSRIKGDDGIPTNEKIKEVMLDIVTGWKGQALVLDDDNNPAEFCREALEVMFKTSGVLDIATRSYLKEVAAKAKN